MTTEISGRPHPETLSWSFFRVRRSELILLLVTLLIAVVPYRYLWERGFTDSDDFEEVDRAITLDLSRPAQIFFTAHEGNRYRPLGRGLNAATAYVFGAKPAGYLLRNLAFHLINTALLFGVICLLLRNTLAAAAAAALFAVHPANVNAVSIAVFTQPFATALLLLGIVLFIHHLRASPAKPDWRPSAAALLFTGLIFSSEMFLWVGPVYALALVWAYLARGKRISYLYALGIVVGGLLLYFFLRQSIVEVTTISAQSADSRYGLRTPAQIARNVGMFLVSSGVAVDYLHFIDPMKQTLPITLDRLPSTGLAVAIGCGLLLSLATIAAAAFGLRRSAPYNLRIAALFAGLFFASIAIVNLMTTASETHTYASNALLIVAQAALVYELMLRIRHRYRSLIVAGVGGLIVLLVAARAVGTDHRNAILEQKSEWVASVQTEARRSAAGIGQDSLAFVLGCDIPAGYSVYGLNRLELLSTRSFITLTMGRQSPRIETISFEQFKSGATRTNAVMRTVMVDARGRMQMATGETTHVTCQQ